MIEYFEGNERMHQIISYKGMLFLSGQTFPSADSIEEQTVGALNKIDRLLADHGSSKDYILSVHIFLRDCLLYTSSPSSVHADEGECQARRNQSDLRQGLFPLFS